MEFIAIVLVAAFAGLAVVHLYWAFGGTYGISAALPSVDGAPLFTPGKAATSMISGVLAGFAIIAFILGFGAGFAVELMPYAVFLGFAVGGVLALRAVGEFRYLVCCPGSSFTL